MGNDGSDFHQERNAKVDCHNILNSYTYIIYMICLKETLLLNSTDSSL